MPGPHWPRSRRSPRPTRPTRRRWPPPGPRRRRPRPGCPGVVEAAGGSTAEWALAAWAVQAAMRSRRLSESSCGHDANLAPGRSGFVREVDDALASPDRVRAWDDDAGDLASDWSRVA